MSPNLGLFLKAANAAKDHAMHGTSEQSFPLEFKGGVACAREVWSYMALLNLLLHGETDMMSSSFMLLSSTAFLEETPLHSTVLQDLTSG